MSALRKSGMVEGQPGDPRHLIAKISAFYRQGGRFCCVTMRSFLAWRVLAIAARVTE